MFTLYAIRYETCEHFNRCHVWCHELFVAFATFGRNSEMKTEQGIASDTIPSHCTILLTGLIAEWILIS